MKEITKKEVVQKFKTVPDGEETIDKVVYVAEDGKEFKWKSECVSHDQELIRKKLLDGIVTKAFDSDLLSTWGNMYLCKNLKDLSSIELYYHIKHYEHYDNCKFPQWFIISFHDGGDYADYYSIDSEEFIKSECRELLNQFRKD